MIQQIRMILVALVLCSSVVGASVAEACPMCQVANEDDTNKAEMAVPRAYMYSILFMLAMPASLFTFFGISFYRLSQKRTAMNEDVLAATYQPEPFDEE